MAIAACSSCGRPLGGWFPSGARCEECQRDELDAATTSKLAGHANPHVTMRVYADDFRKASERNAAVLKRAAERGFGS